MNSATMKDRLNQLSTTLLDLVQQVEGLKALHNSSEVHTVTETVKARITRRVWDPRDLETLKHGHRNGLSVKQVASELNRTVGSILTRASLLGLRFRTSSRRGTWTAEMDKDLTQFHQQGVTDEVIARNMDRTPSAVRKRLSTLGLLQSRATHTAGRRLWTNEENRKLVPLALAGHSLSTLGRSFDRTPGAVNAQLRRLMSKEDFATYTEISA